MRNLLIIFLILLLAAQFCIGTINAQTYDYYTDESGASLTQDTSAMAYNLTAIAQTDPDGNGPSYIVQGLTDTGYLYQEGITYDGFDSKFLFFYSVFNPTGTRILNSSLSGIDIGKINPNDKILLDIFFGNANRNIYFYVRDYNTGADYVLNYSSGSATKFVGNQNSISDQNHFFTGLVTNWDHVSATQTSQTITYTPTVDVHSPARLWMFALQDTFSAPGEESRRIIANFTSPIVSYSAQSAFKLNSQGVSYYKGVFSTGAIHLIPLSIQQADISNLTADSNGPCNLNASAFINGGKSPYTYTLYIDNSSVATSITSNTNATLTVNCRGIISGSHHYYVKVVDSNKNYTSTQIGNIKVAPAIQILSSLAISQNSFFYNNDTEKVSVTLSGGTQPYKYDWYSNNNLVLNLNGPNQSIHLDNGQNFVTLTVQDAAGANLTGITISANTSYDYPHILLVVLIILIILIILLVRWYLYNRDEYYHIDKDLHDEDDANSSSINIKNSGNLNEELQDSEETIPTDNENNNFYSSSYSLKDEEKAHYSQESNSEVESKETENRIEVDNSTNQNSQYSIGTQDSKVDQETQGSQEAHVSDNNDALQDDAEHSENTNEENAVEPTEEDEPASKDDNKEVQDDSEAEQNYTSDEDNKSGDKDQNEFKMDNNESTNQVDSGEETLIDNDSKILPVKKKRNSKTFTTRRTSKSTKPPE